MQSRQLGNIYPTNQANIAYLGCSGSQSKGTRLPLEQQTTNSPIDVPISGNMRTRTWSKCDSARACKLQWVAGDWTLASLPTNLMASENWTELSAAARAARRPPHVPEWARIRIRSRCSDFAHLTPRRSIANIYFDDLRLSRCRFVSNIVAVLKHSACECPA